MDIKVRHGTEADVAGYHRCLDVVARERRYIGLVEAPELSASRAWIEVLLRENFPFVIADKDGEIVGWCDIGPVRRRPGFMHVGGLRMAVHPAFRGSGIGPKVLSMALEKAPKSGLERVELEVFASNERAIKLYQKFGFEIEGLKKRARKLDGGYEDHILMAKLFGPVAE